MIRGICWVFLFGLDIAIFMPQGSTVIQRINPELLTVEPKFFRLLWLDHLN